MHQIIAYIKFLLKSTNQHGVHSPFVYNLLTKSLYKTEKRPAFKTIRAYIKAVRLDNRIISIKDFGAGSRVFNSNERKVSDIAKNAAISSKRALLLNRLTSYLNIETALELGTSLGISSTAITAGNQIKLTTLEGCPETSNIAREYFKKFGLNTITLKVGNFDELLSEEHWRIEIKDVTPALEHQKKQHSLDLIYFDGNHQKEATLIYFNQLLPLAHNDSVFIFDDIHWSKGMEEAWEEIKAHPSVRVSIDSFFWGLVFFREEQEKEHFTLRL
ncbi:O-methyltransferase [Gillisia limnaea]|uniref:Methyltransferase n=1 Tax=Gillisia limnaea (strain DSM 15749 / LMG 21470 / R-8282) TaxID=865937 RepID=H2BSS1_GILLR|nr:class I SAM-dependent methyltransferase [Gillisia limnaea]EHQ03657.1 methyltransferase [Gillisia limnaea DSM 15749]